MKRPCPGTRVPLRLKNWFIDHPMLAPARSPHLFAWVDRWPAWTDIPIEGLGYVLADQEDTRGNA